MMSSFAYDRCADRGLPKCPSIGRAKCPEGPTREFRRCPCRGTGWAEPSWFHGRGEARWLHPVERPCRKRTALELKKWTFDLEWSEAPRDSRLQQKQKRT